MRFWSVFAPLCTISLFGQNQATQLLSLTVTVDLSKNVTLAAYQETTYTSLSDSSAYILVPTASVTKSGDQILSAGKIELDFQVQVRPIQTAAESFQLQGSVLPQRYNLLGFLGSNYYSPQFYLLQLQGKTSQYYVYPAITIEGNAMKLWNQGQTTIGTGTNVPSMTTALTWAPSYTTPNLLENSTGTTATQTLNLTLSIPSTVTQIPSGVYFFQVYLTLNPYQTISNETLANFLSATQQFLIVLLKQSSQYDPKLYTPELSAQLAANQVFLSKEITEVTAVINSL